MQARKKNDDTYADLDENVIEHPAHGSCQGDLAAVRAVQHLHSKVIDAKRNKCGYHHEETIE